MAANDILALDAILTATRADRAPEMSDAKYFEFFAADQILKDFQLSDDDIESGRVDGPDDGGVDLIYFFINRSLVAEDTPINPKAVTRADLILIQATREAAFKEARVSKLYMLIEDLLSLSKPGLTGTYNPLLKAGISLFKNQYKKILSASHDLAISFYYVSKGETAKINTALKEHADRIPKKARELFTHAECTFSFVGDVELLSLARRRAQRSYSLELAEQPLMAKGTKSTAICLVPLDKYYAFITDDETGDLRQSLFDSNVRGWKGNVKVNKAISSSLEQAVKTEDFWWLNNGITILATEVSNQGNHLKICDPQIVNGLQTSRSIYNHFKAHPSTTESPMRNVLVRVITPEHAASRDRIIQATNSQTHRR